MTKLTPKVCPDCETLMIPHFKPGGAVLYCLGCKMTEAELIEDTKREILAGRQQEPANVVQILTEQDVIAALQRIKKLSDAIEGTKDRDEYERLVGQVLQYESR